MLSNSLSVSLSRYFCSWSYWNIDEAVIDSHSVVFCHDRGDHSCVWLHTQRCRYFDDSIVCWSKVEITISSKATTILIDQLYDLLFGEFWFHQNFNTFSSCSWWSNWFRKSFWNSNSEWCQERYDDHCGFISGNSTDTIFTRYNARKAVHISGIGSCLGSVGEFFRVWTIEKTCCCIIG